MTVATERIIYRYEKTVAVPDYWSATLPPPLTALTLSEPQTTIRQLVVQSSINPVTAEFIVEQIEAANKNHDLAILLQLDTPGGLDSAMRMIIQTEMQSRRPVIVYVAPSGARSASAGALITMAADFAVMAPGTNIGAAHPVSLGGGQQSETMQKKVMNDAVAYIKSLAEQRGRNVEWAVKAVRDSASISAVEALKLKVIDLVAEDTVALLKGLDGKTYLRDGKPVVFTSRQAQLKKLR